MQLWGPSSNIVFLLAIIWETFCVFHLFVFLLSCYPVIPHEHNLNTAGLTISLHVSRGGGQPLTSCEIWIYTWWLLGLFPCQPSNVPDSSDALVWHCMQSLLWSLRVSPYEWVHIRVTIDQLLLKQMSFIDIKFNSNWYFLAWRTCYNRLPLKYEYTSHISEFIFHV